MRLAAWRQFFGVSPSVARGFIKQGELDVVRDEKGHVWGVSVGAARRWQARHKR